MPGASVCGLSTSRGYRRSGESGRRMIGRRQRPPAAVQVAASLRLATATRRPAVVDGPRPFLADEVTGVDTPEIFANSGVALMEKMR
ncbi:hypothetical protein QE152_g34078 [Popillia japonica]|uniref:Uncharacterized protein n=1 Tax=Popillia japonica TaxID=7064 RepID=A0AAW1IUC6_POPJA